MIHKVMDYSFSRLQKFRSSLVYGRFRWFLLPTGPQTVPALADTKPTTKSATVEQAAGGRLGVPGAYVAYLSSLGVCRSRGRSLEFTTGGWFHMHQYIAHGRHVPADLLSNPLGNSVRLTHGNKRIHF